MTEHPTHKLNGELQPKCGAPDNPKKWKGFFMWTNVTCKKCLQIRHYELMQKKLRRVKKGQKVDW